jgi:hypothetical protein
MRLAVKRAASFIQQARFDVTIEQFAELALLAFREPTALGSRNPIFTVITG